LEVKLATMAGISVVRLHIDARAVVGDDCSRRAVVHVIARAEQLGGRSLSMATSYALRPVGVALQS